MFVTSKYLPAAGQRPLTAHRGPPRHRGHAAQERGGGGGGGGGDGAGRQQADGALQPQAALPPLRPGSSGRLRARPAARGGDRHVAARRQERDGQRPAVRRRGGRRPQSSRHPAAAEVRRSRPALPRSFSEGCRERLALFVAQNLQQSRQSVHVVPPAG